MNNKSFTLAHSARELLAQAQIATGITDIVDNDIARTLDKLIQSLNTEAELNEAGAKAMERHILLVLCNRLRMFRDFREHPEIAEQRIARPIIMSGGPRTGSTKLQKMLAAGGDFNVLLCWQGLSMSLLSGDRGEDPAPRIREADWHVRWFNEHAPKARLIHEFSTFEPEEENLLLAQCLFAPYMLAFVFTLGYIQWYMENRDLREDFRFLKRTLQYLQWQFHDGKGRPWLLKNPTYPGYEPLLAEVFPDAAFITTNREPVGKISSSLSLLDNYHVAYSDVERRAILGPMLLEAQAAGLEQQMAGREAHPEMRFLDLGYGEITRSVESVVKKIYAHAGVGLHDDAWQAMQAWERDNTQHKLGVHQHGLEQFGLTAAMVQNRFAKHTASFGTLF